MSRLLSTLLLLVTCILGMTAQQLKIESVTLDPVDLTAQTEMRKDLNGVPCALVKVRLTLGGALFSGNVVGEVKNHVGEYYVYMTDGSKELRLKQERVKPLAIYFPDYQIPELASGATYVVDLSVPESLWTGPVAPKKEIYNYLLLHVIPADAKVFVDGQERSVMGGESSVLLNEGVHTVRVEASGYLTAEETVTIADRKVEKTINLRSTKATLTVRSATPGAEILLNGRSVGTGQWSGSVMPDTYIVELRKAGCRSAEKRVILAQNQTETLDFPALEVITGDLDVTSSPSGATVEFDGRVLGTTPDIFRSLPVGSHTLRLTLSGYTPATSTVTISESEIAHHSIPLSKNPSASSAPSSPSSSSSYSFNDGYSSVSPAYGHLKPAHLDLATEMNGQYLYFTKGEWNRLPDSVKICHDKIGIVIDQPSITPAFILALTDNGKDVTWDEAMASGINMPSKIQGEAIVKDCKKVKKALKAFGGTGYEGLSQWFWTKEECKNSSGAWLVYMYNGSINYNSKSITGRVRAVAPVPVAAM